MKFTVNTKVFQDMINKAVKGAGNNKVVPMTSFLGIKVDNNILSLTTYDTTNTLVISHEGVTGNGFNLAIPVEVISKLVGKTTSENMTFSTEDNKVLKVKGNGNYTVQIPLDEKGEAIVFSNVPEFENFNSHPINLADVKSVLTFNKPSLAITMEQPYLTKYYLGDKVISTDTFKVCANNINMLSVPMLFSPSTIELLALASGESIVMQEEVGTDRVKFVGKGFTLFSYQQDELELYPVEPIENYLKSEFNQHIVINREELLNALDRLSLFITPYDKNAITLNFTQQRLIISSGKSSSIEEILYIDSTFTSEFNCDINIITLRQQIAAHSSESIRVWFGNENAIKITADKITQIVALLDEE